MDLRGMVEQARPELLVEQVLRDFDGEVAVAVIRHPCADDAGFCWEARVDTRTGELVIEGCG